MIIVPDTNVYVSAILDANGYPGQIERAWRKGVVGIALSEPILDEVRRVLSYERLRRRHNWSLGKLDKYLADLHEIATITPGSTPLNAVEKDKSDNKFFVCAVEARADYVVSGDKEHVLPVGEYRGVRAISPRDFVESVMNLRKVA